MSNARILHIARDEKFVDMAIQAFDKLSPSQNDLCLYANAAPRFVKTKPSRIHGKWRAMRGLQADYLGSYDMVLVHSLHPAFFRTLLHTPATTAIIWAGWGYDYYDLIHPDEADILLPQTRKKQADLSLKQSWRAKLKLQLEQIGMPAKTSVLERVDLFAPVLPNEYPLVAEACSAHRFPRFLKWNYGSLEDNLVKGLESNWVMGDSILLGNNSAFTNNHSEALELLASIQSSQQVIAPLSYGSILNRESVIEEGTHLLGERFVPLVDFMPIDRYNQQLLQCGFAIMNHVRQQAVGNIVTMLYLGARVFMRDECETYRFFQSEGAHVNSMHELESDPSLLQTPLPMEQRQVNRRVVQKHWSRDASDGNTQALLEQALALKSTQEHVAA